MPQETQTCCEVYDDCVAAIYSAAVGVMPWQKVCDQIAKLISATAIYITGIDKSSGQLKFSWAGGTMSQKGFLDYATRYHAINPQLPLVMKLQNDEWLQDHLHFNEQYVSQSPFYQEFAIPYGARYAVATRLIDEPDSAVILATMRSARQSPLDDTELAQLARIRRHLRNAIAIHFRLRKTLNDLSVGHDLVNSLPYPVFITTLGGKLLHQNQSANDLIERTDLVSSEQSYLQLTDPEANAQLDESLQLMRQSLATVGQPGQQTFVIPIGRPVTRAAVIGMIIDPDATMNAFGMEPLTMLLIHKVDHQPASDPFIIGKIFDLTPAESIVGAHLANGGSIQSISQSRGVSEHTVRAQVRSIYVKLNVSSLSELTRRLVGIPHFSNLVTQVSKQAA